MRNKLIVASALSAVFALVCSDSSAVFPRTERFSGVHTDKKEAGLESQSLPIEEQIAEKFNSIDPSKSFINRYIKREGSYERLVEFFSNNPGDPEREIAVRKIFDGSTERTLAGFNRALDNLNELEVKFEQKSMLKKHRDTERERKFEQKLVWIKNKSENAEKIIRHALRCPFSKMNEIVQLIEFIDSTKDVDDEHGKSFLAITSDVYKQLSANIAGPSAPAGQVKIKKPWKEFIKGIAENVPLVDGKKDERKWESILNGNPEYINSVPPIKLSEGLEKLVRSLFYPYNEEMREALEREFKPE